MADRASHHGRPSVTSGPLSVRSLRKIVAAATVRADVEESAHQLPHTVATRLVRDSRERSRPVAESLGHADVKTTRRCSRSDRKQRRAALEDLAD